MFGKVLWERGVMSLLNSSNGAILSFDETKLFYHYWGTDKINFDKLVLVLHGIGFHGSPYQIVAQYLNPHNIPVYALDTRGHGQSGGERGIMGSSTVLLQDVECMISFLKGKHPGKKIFLLGDSMGGSIALAYAAEDHDSLTGLIVIAPGLQLKTEIFFQFETLKVLSRIAFSGDPRVVSLVNSNLKVSSRQQEFIDFKRNDPLSLDKISMSYLMTLNSLSSNWESRYSTKIKISTLILHGGKDSIIDPSTSQKLYDVLGISDKKLVMLPNAFHTLFWDIDTPKAFEEIAAWLKTR